MIEAIDNFKPLKRSNAYWLRDVYNNIARFRGRNGVSVVHASEGIRVVGESTDAGQGTPQSLVDFWNRGGLLSTRQLNQLISIYNSAAGMFGRGLGVSKSESQFFFTDNETGGGNFNWPRLSQVRAGIASETIFNRRIRGPLVALANAWIAANAADSFVLTKSELLYILEDGFAGFFEDFDDELGTGAASTLLNWNVIQHNVDVLGPGYFDLVPGNGFYLDMAGTAMPVGAGAIIRTKEKITARGNLVFSYKIAGDLRNNGNSVLEFRFGDITQQHTLPQNQNPTTYTHHIANGVDDFIEIEQISIAGLDKSAGSLLLEVTVARP